MKEDKMEAQQRVISEREESISERENEVAQKSAENNKKTILLDSLIEDAGKSRTEKDK